eukprot:COSAG01_NODE_14550_length_1439_cov_1.479104_2_plen_48_part_00
MQSYAWNSVWERLASQDRYQLRHIHDDSGLAEVYLRFAMPMRIRMTS